MKDNRNLWTIGAAILMATIVMAVTLFGIVPIFLELQVINTTREVVDADNQKRDDFLTQLKETAQDKENMLIEITKKRELIPNKLGIVELMNELNELGNGSGVVVSALSVTPPQVFTPPTNFTRSTEYQKAVANLSTENLFVADISISITGKLNDVTSYMEKLRTGERYLLVAKVVIPESNAADSNVVTADLSGQIFTMLSN